MTDKMKWRLILDKSNNAQINMAIDEAIMQLNAKTNLPTLRLYTWNPPAVSIGLFQSLEDEIDIASCNKFNVDFVRRITGGGAVFHDNELTYSFVISENNDLIPKQILESYGVICGAIIQGLDLMGVKSTFAPVNDILAEGKKISGNAQTRRNNTILQHGTILIDVDIDKMFSLLKVPNEKVKDKLIFDVKQRVTSLKHILGRSVQISEVENSMIAGFKKQFNIEFVKKDLTKEEKQLANELMMKKFSTREWNYKR